MSTAADRRGGRLARGREVLGGLIRYGLVGVVNATTYYATYLLVHGHASYLVAHAVGLGTAMVVSFFLNCRITFRVRPTWTRFLLYPASQVVNVVATTAGVVGLVQLGTDQRLAPLFAAILAVPVSFAAARMLMTRGPAARSGGDGPDDEPDDGTGPGEDGDAQRRPTVTVVQAPRWMRSPGRSGTGVSGPNGSSA